MSQPIFPPVAVVGSTGVGKSSTAIDVALKLEKKGIKSEIINSDSMQLYRGMNIGTAKVTEREKAGIKHHMLDVLDVTQEASVARFQEKTRDLIKDLQSRQILPLLVGGSGLYVRAALDILEFPPQNPSVRQEVEKEALEYAQKQSAQPEEQHKYALNYLRAQLKDVDRQARAEELELRRLVRALEVYRISGRSFSSYMPERKYVQPAVQFGLDLDRQKLHYKIAARVQEMIKQGFLDEVKTLESQGIRQSKTASKAVGYAQMLDVLYGLSTLDEAAEKTIISTRQLARRQKTWFGADQRITWLDSQDPQRVDHIVETLLDELEKL